MTDVITRFAAIIGRGRPTPSEPEEIVNVPDEDVDVNIRSIMGDKDISSALINLIDAMAAESNREMSVGRKDHADMLFHHGGYARLQDLKMELQRLAGLTGS